MRRVVYFLVCVASLLLNVTASAIEADLTELVKQNHEAIVNITTTYVSKVGTPNSVPMPEQDSPFYEFFRRYFEQELPEKSPLPLPEEPKSAGNGSGFIVSADGYVLTNTHVVKDADEVVVALNDRREYEAKVVGMDERSDVALLKIDATGLPIVKLGDSETLKVGQWVIAIGSPFGFDHSATQGIISALGRSLPDENYVPFIQTDVAVNPGNSGGPLFNLAGEVIGINSQIYSRSGGYMGLSFAIPINLAVHVMEQLKATGKVSRGWLGVLIQSVNSDLAQSFGLEKPAGALVAKVMSDSPAKNAGIEVGDIIVEYNGKHIDMHHDLPSLVGMTTAGSKASLKVLRKGREVTLQVAIGELPENPQAADGSSQVSTTTNRLNIGVADMSEEDRKVTGTETGVIVKQVGTGPASIAGIRKGDVILQLNHAEIKNAEQFEQVVADLPSQKPVSMLIQRDNGAFFVTVEVSAEDK